MELDPALASTAQRRAAELGVRATVVVGDAGSARTWQSILPVDLLLLCGIFGNISEADICNTIAAARGMLAPRGSVIWTRGYITDQDLRPQIGDWFIKAGFSETAFDFEPTGYGVGVNQLLPDAPTATIPDRLFSFVR